MLSRSRSKDRSRKVTPPSPSFMSNEKFGTTPSLQNSPAPKPKRVSIMTSSIFSQSSTSLTPSYSQQNWTAEYLADLRNNRVARPTGARPPPSSTPGHHDSHQRMPASSDEHAQRAESVASTHRHAQSNFSMKSRTGRSFIQEPTSEFATRNPPGPAMAPMKPLKLSEVVPSATYIERGQRWMEREEAYSLSVALEDMDIAKQKKEEARLQAAAQAEASELVWQHQNPQATQPEGLPYKYKEHLRKNSYAHARTESVGRSAGVGITTGLARDFGSRTVSGSSSGSDGRRSQSRVASGSSRLSQAFTTPRQSLDQDRQQIAEQNAIDASKDSRTVNAIKKPYHGLSKSLGPAAGRRRSSGKRNISGELVGSFTGDQIWQEPSIIEESRGRSPEVEDMPAPLRLKPRNPLNRVQFAPEEPVRANSTPPEPTKRLSRYEIHQNPPSQSRNPAYTSNPPPAPAKDMRADTPTKDGIEIRGDEIREATSMKLKDRSPKLPTPTVVSDKPGRPIVSFDADWKPKEADLKSVEEQRRKRSPFDRRFGASGETTKIIPPLPHAKTFPSTSVPSIQFPDEPSVKVTQPISQVSRPKSITNTTDRPQTIPSINVPDICINQFDESPQFARSISSDIRSSQDEGGPNIPIINFPDSPSATVIPGPSIPSINFPNSPSTTTNETPSIPTINFPDIPSVQINNAAPTLTNNISTIPQISVSGPAALQNQVGFGPVSKSARALPDPKTQSSRPVPRHHASAPIQRGHWSPAPGSRATATCHQCQLPIEGRVVALRGIRQRFHPHCFICFTCGTGLEALEISPEPDDRRAARLDRIHRREAGEYIEEVEGQTMAEDGDERLRFYCHLDWHESFAPRCKHCTTPIIGEHTVALGAHWHYGHFFCAECGDPFEQGMTHIEKDGYAWCLSCQTKRTERRAPKCLKCKKAVIGQYVEALGGEWHDECFKCAACQGGFDDGQIFPREDGSVFCTGCMERELKA